MLLSDEKHDLTLAACEVFLSKKARDGLAAERAARIAAEKESEGRRKTLLDKSEELRREWIRAEAAEARETETQRKLASAAVELRGYVEAGGFAWQDDQPVMFNVTTAMGWLNGTVETLNDRVADLERRLAAVTRRAEKFDPADDELEFDQVECPLCGHCEEDLDGLGFARCNVCGHCAHVCWTGNKCDGCGKEVADA